MDRASEGSFPDDAGFRTPYFREVSWTPFWGCAVPALQFSSRWMVYSALCALCVLCGEFTRLELASDLFPTTEDTEDTEVRV